MVRSAPHSLRFHTFMTHKRRSFSRDPEEYPDPGAFKPERFLAENPPRDPDDYVFGFGRMWDLSCPCCSHSRRLMYFIPGSVPGVTSPLHRSSSIARRCCIPLMSCHLRTRRATRWSWSTGGNMNLHRKSLSRTFKGGGGPNLADSHMT